MLFSCIFYFTDDSVVVYMKESDITDDVTVVVNNNQSKLTIQGEIYDCVTSGCTCVNL